MRPLFYALVISTLSGLLINTSSAQEITLSFLDQTVEEDSIFNAELIVSDFDDIVSMQGTFVWDPAVIEFAGIVDFVLPISGTVESHFGTFDVAVGSLTFSWFDADVAGINFDDDTAIFSIQFRALSTTAPQNSTIDFINTPTAIEISNANFEVLDVAFSPGTITVVPFTSSVEQQHWTAQAISYPNPTKGKLIVDLGQPQAFIQANLKNSAGQLVQQSTFSNTSRLELDIEGPAGIYLLELENEQLQQVEFKVVKE